MSDDFERYLAEQLKNPEFKKDWEAMEPEFQAVSAMIDARNAQEMTQKELSEKTGITQADISRIENGNANPTVKMLKRIANGLGMALKIEFVPKRSERLAQ